MTTTIELTPGEEIRILRSRHTFTAESVALRANVHPATVRAVERGEAGEITTSYLLRIVREMVDELASSDVQPSANATNEGVTTTNATPAGARDADSAPVQ